MYRPPPTDAPAAPESDHGRGPRAPRPAQRPGAWRVLRPFAIALILLIAFDLVLRLPVFPLFPHPYRTPVSTSMAVEQYVEYLSRRDGVRVVVLGDSISQGYLVENDETYPNAADAIAHDRYPGTHVYNLGLTAGKMQDMELVSGMIAEKDAADVIVVQYDYLLHTLPNITRRYPELLGTRGLGKAQRTLDNAVSRKVARVWRALAWRDYFDAVLFGGRPAAQLNSLVTIDTGKVVVDPDPIVPSKDPKRAAPMWKVPVLTEENAQVEALLGLAENGRDAGIPVVVMVGPLNDTYRHELGFLDEKRYRANMRFLNERLAERGARVVDLSGAVPPTLLMDSVHPVPAGHRVLADKMLRAIEPDMRTAGREARR